MQNEKKPRKVENKMKKLQMVFKNAEGRRQQFTPKVVDENLSAEQVQAIMEGIVNLQIFSKDGIPQFCEVVSARYVETETIELF